MKKLPIGLQNINEIITEGYVYVDKTKFIVNLLKYKHYFISRPRRFGKSLFLSTLEEVFSGNKDLFKGYYIYDSDYSWQKYPVIFLDFSQVANHTPQEFEDSLKRTLQDIATAKGISIPTPTIQEGIKKLIIGLFSEYKSKVVVLTDEYDKPIVDTIGDLEVSKKNRDLLKDLFSTIKSLDKYIKFNFVTGVSKFSQVSLFSGPNNLTDITFDTRYAGMMGYTERELKKYFAQYIKRVAKHRGKKSKEVVQEIRGWYNGYRFSERKLSVYNPYSTLLFLDSKKAKSYWYRTGTPSFLIEKVKNQPQLIAFTGNHDIAENILVDISNLERINISTLMFQTGYLTIKDYNQEEDSYKLDFPNKEVREAFFNSLLQDFVEIDPLDVNRKSEKIITYLKTLNLKQFVNIMNLHFAKIPYQVFAHAREGFFQAVIFTLLVKSGIKTQAEVSTSIGRIDLYLD